MTVRVKICGLTREDDVASAVEYGADALGFVLGYHGSTRDLTFKQVKKLTIDIPPYVSTVVVSPVRYPNFGRVIEEIRPSFLQLYDDGGNSFAIEANLLEQLDKTFANIIRTVRPLLGKFKRQLQDEEGEKRGIVERCLEISKTYKGILLDFSLSSRYHNAARNEEEKAENHRRVYKPDEGWELGRKIRDAVYPFPVILAGGLNETNVQSAIEAVRPYAVDVSSGIENAPGIKDKRKIERFIQNAKDTKP